VPNAIADQAAGGEVLFIGTVRNNDVDKRLVETGSGPHTRSL
jgi:molybdopterin synthase catalytic subunit